MSTDPLFRSDPGDMLKVDIVGLPLYDYNSQLMVTIFTTASKKATEKAMLYFKDRVKWAAGIQDMHTLKMMKRKGFGKAQNPYAKRHWSPGFVFSPTERIIGHIYWRVHKQSGTLYNAIKTSINEQRGNFKYEGSTASVFIDESAAPHAKFVIWGTKKMISRNFMLWTWNKEQEKVEEIIDREFKHAMQLWKVRDP